MASYLSGSKALFDAALLDPSFNSDGVRCRPLQSDDYDRNFMALLGQLTVVGDVSRDAWQARFREMRNAGCYYTIVFEDE